MSNNHRDLTSPTLDFGIQKNFVTPAITGFDSIFTPLDFSKLLPELFEGSGLSESDGIFKKISEIGGLFDDLGVNSSFKTFESFIPGIQQVLIDFEDSNDLPDGDYVIVDENAVKVLDLTGSIFIPLGNYRVKIHTWSLILLLFSMCEFSYTQYQNYQQAKQTAEYQERILEIQEDTNKTLHDLVDSIDATNSSQQEVIDSLSDATKRLLDSSQVPSAVFRDPESSVDHSAVTPDNNRE
nr:MAG TPA: hypothetical protein [Caudoviricetes sp.]